MAFLSALGAATFIGAGAGSPLNFCQSPVTRKMAATASVGWGPTPSQYCARSLSTSMKDGSSLGWYLPMVSIDRPSRLVRASATTLREYGARILPRRMSLILVATVCGVLLERVWLLAGRTRGGTPGQSAGHGRGW